MTIEATNSLCWKTIQQDISCQRNHTSYKKLFLYFYPPLCSFAKSIVKKSEAAEEIVLDVMVRIWIKKDLPAIDNLKVYLYKATKNASLTYLVKNRKYDTIPLDQVNVEFDLSLYSPADILIDNELKKVISWTVNSLPPKCQMVYKLVREDGLSYKEVAAIMEISTNTVDRHLSNALQKIIRSTIKYLE